MSYLTDAELAALQESALDPFTPFAIQGVSRTQLSVSRHYGGCTYNGAHYVYNPVTDELIREDVLKWIGKRRNEERKAEKRETEAKQMEMM